MNESPIDPSDEAAPEPSENADAEAPSNDQTAGQDASERVVEAFDQAAEEEAVADAAIEAALEETVVEAVQDAAAIEAASDAAIEESFEEKMYEAVDAGLEGEALEDAVEQAAADADVQEAIADAVIIEALEETVEEAVEDAKAVEAVSDAAILGDLADEVESIAADVEATEEAEAPSRPRHDGGADASRGRGEPTRSSRPRSPRPPRRRARRPRRPPPLPRRRSPPTPTEGAIRSAAPATGTSCTPTPGYENKVKTNLESRIHTMQMEDKIFDVHIPMEDVMEIKGGKKQVVQRKVFPGYLLVKMVYDNDSWYVVRNTPGVTGFVAAGTGTKPTPLSRREVEKILVGQEGRGASRSSASGSRRATWCGSSRDRSPTSTARSARSTLDQIKLKVLVNIFDRETPVELSFDQVAKV